jgi:hypothetical protein
MNAGYMQMYSSLELIDVGVHTSSLRCVHTMRRLACDSICNLCATIHTMYIYACLSTSVRVCYIHVFVM